ncbi:ferrochelatase [Shewanella putrefaciens]|jgi:ferrochelatase|uniref:ferrochelatase n=1 Tax=Shewanella TaxID=22 RepID=UPI000DFDE542|nr:MULTISPECIES: ferrochelatase [Shewanella]CAD6367117.1 Ferrochelatase [Shewanella hafniensis]MCK7629393.1 ferrochelatase [Shewanella sp. JNE9-1]MCK7633348.1 ferrochelatase [Shewanella sp. JNE17]MCK7644563.1 ferrochelatase [Shewanella sp. JNE3-1]MCK7648573.1 ferrochelatase [Shewanella sp. JNE8]
MLACRGNWLIKGNTLTSPSPAFGVLLVNLGTPDEPTPKAVKRFLKQFLSDPRVVDLSPWLWQPLLNGIILNTRPAKVAKLYQSIWTDEGSPLMVLSSRQAQKLAVDLSATFNQDIPVELGMSYGNPSIDSGFARLKAQGAERIVVLPLYPQYSCSTVASVFDAVASYLKTVRDMPELRFNKHYFDHEAYIAALAHSVKRHWKTYGQADKLLLSFHGIPLRYVKEGDPYREQCLVTAKLLAQKLELNETQWQVCFQSRFGREEWLTPYADELLAKLPSQGIKSVDVICPAFATDCLETLEEISIGGKETFLHAGGETYRFIPCLNDDEMHIELLRQLVQEQAHSWNYP